jgi:hypothetical protein
VAVTKQVPVALLIVIVALPAPLPLHAPEPAIFTGFPLAPPLAATVKLSPFSALAGACVVKVTLWPSWTVSLNKPTLPRWLLSPEYVAVTASVAAPARVEVVHVATPGFPVVTGVVPQPVFALHVTVPLTSWGFPFPFRPLRTSPFSPLIVAVNVTGCP